MCNDVFLAMSIETDICFFRFKGKGLGLEPFKIFLRFEVQEYHPLSTSARTIP